MNINDIRAAIIALGLNPDEAPKSSRTVNKVLRALGREEVLVRGNGYWYFAEGDASGWYSSSVGVYRITDLSLIRWAEELFSLAAR